jgi:hypothetical protein
MLRRIQLNARISGLVVGATTIAGLILLVSVLASGPLAAFEAESGGRQGNATVAPLAGASGGSVIKFSGPASSGYIQQTGNLAAGKTISASSVSTIEPGHPANFISDANESTRWISQPADASWVAVDLGANYQLTKIDVVWAGDTTHNFQLQTSWDNITWTTVASGATNNSAIQFISTSTFNTTPVGRYVRVYGLDRWNAAFGHSIWELGIYGATTTMTPPPTPSHAYGMADGSLFLSSTQGADLDDIASLGMKWIRTDFDWKSLQPTAGAPYNWSRYDPYISAAAGRNLQILGVLDYAPDWAAASGCQPSAGRCPPASTAQWVQYVTDTVNHYQPMGVHTWEIWNEPNTPGFWGPAPNAAAYVSLLKSAYPVIKRLDPQAVVLTAGLATAYTVAGGTISPEDFLSGVYAAGGKDYFDAVSAHPYCFPASPLENYSWSGWQRMLNMRSIMDAQGDSAKKVWLTEYGAPTNGPGLLATEANRNYDRNPDHVDEAYQAVLMQIAITQYQSYNWVGPLFIYMYKDSGTATTTPENFFGLRRNDGSAKPAYTAVKAALGT